MIIFALSGWKASGKDMAADYLVKNHGFTRVSFADPLKDNVAQAFGIPRSSLDDRELKEAPLLNAPVEPKDAFSRNIAEFMKGEFRDQNGKRYGEAPVDSVMYWTPRALCILEGSTKRSADINYWVKQAVAKMVPGGRYVIADLRYQSEVNALNASAPNSVIAARIDRFEVSTSADPSERDLDAYPFPFRINNLQSESTTQNQVFEQIVSVLKQKGLIDDGAEHGSRNEA